MIHVYLVRPGPTEGTGALRSLSPKARKRFRKTARSLSRKTGALDAILASPRVRAVQTAEILAATLKPRALSVLPELAPGEPAEALLKAVSRSGVKSGSIAV